MTPAKYLASAMFVVAAHACWAADDAGVNPYRPSVSNPAQLPTPGRLELEFGGLHVKQGEARTDTLPYLFKLGFSKKWGVLLGGDAQIWSRNDEGVRERSFGDTSVTLKRSFEVNDSTGFGLEFGVKLPTAKDTIATGIGKAEYKLNGIYSQDFGRVHMDANLNTTRVGVVQPGTARMQTGLSTAISAPVSSDWRSIAEVSGIYRSGTATTGQLLAAVVYSPNKRYAIDFGVTKGLNGASQDWSIFSGFVIPLARLW